MNEKLQPLIEANKALFWYIPEDKKKNISEDILIEFVLNYGDYESCKALFNTLGTQEVANIYHKHLGSARRGENYFPEIRRYFTTYFERNAPRSS